MEATPFWQRSKLPFCRATPPCLSGNPLATGHLTHIAYSPPAWSGSVADFNNWRVIEQSELSPIVEAISQIPGYGNVKEWFFSAVPKLSQYVVIPESRVLHVRFRASCPSDSLERITGCKVRE